MTVDLIDLALLILTLLGIMDIRRRVERLEKAVFDGQLKEEKKLLRGDERRVRKLHGRIGH